MSDARTKIHFRDGDSVTVQGTPDEIAAELGKNRGSLPVPLQTVQDQCVYVNWSNVTYLYETDV